MCSDPRGEPGPRSIAADRHIAQRSSGTVLPHAVDGRFLAARYGIVTAGDDPVTTVACCRPVFRTAMTPRKCESGGPPRQCNDANVNGALTPALLPLSVAYDWASPFRTVLPPAQRCNRRRVRFGSRAAHLDRSPICAVSARPGRRCCDRRCLRAHGWLAANAHA
jgi:hypothetical protein